MPTAQLTLGRPAVHRVVGREREGNDLLFATEGDANGTADPNPVPAENAVSKVGFGVPYLGYVSQFVRSGPGITLLMMIAGSVIIFKGVRNIRHEVAEIRGRRLSRDIAGASTSTTGNQRTLG